MPSSPIIPIQWIHWYEKICQRLELNPSLTLDKQLLPRPWFLFPTQKELADTEGKQLLYAVRKYLRPHDTEPTSYIRSILDALSPEASLVVLYAVRYVAYLEAGNHYFWPALREHLFEDRLTYNDVAIGLAGTFKDLWLKLYNHSNGLLYIPLSGPSRIKWPLAHAGLIPDYKSVLEEFGQDLLLTSDTEHDRFGESVVQETDDFILTLRDWMQAHPEYLSSAIGQLMGQERTERTVIADLAQRWLQLQRLSLEERLATTNRRGDASLSLNRYLRYLPESNQIGIFFSLGSTQKSYDAALEWQSKNYALHFQQSEKGQRNYHPLFLPLFAPNWPDEAALHLSNKGDVSTQSVRMPEPINGQSVVFNTTNGRQTKRWQTDESYYLFLPGKHLEDNPDSLDILFSDWSDLSLPDGDWQDYRLLWVHTRATLTESIDTLRTVETVVEGLALPSFQHQTRERLRLFGAMVHSTDNDAHPVYTHSDPPSLEVTGLWPGFKPLILSERNALTNEYSELKRTWLAANNSSTRHVVELWVGPPQPGTFRVTFDSATLEFSLCADDDSRLKTKSSILGLDFAVEDPMGNILVNPSRYALPESTFVVCAWPLAELQLHFEDMDRAYSIQHMLQTDIHGTCRIEYLPVDWTRFPPGAIQLRLSWRGLFERTQLAVDRSYITADTFQTHLKPADNDAVYAVSCSGTVIGDVDYLVGCLLPDVPWRQPPRQIGLPVQLDGAFAGRVIVTWKPTWIVLGSHTLLSGDDPQIAKVDGLSEHFVPSFSINLLDELEKYDFETWARLASLIVTVSHPPLLENFVAVAPLMLFLSRWRSILAAESQWVFINKWADLIALHSELPTGAKVAIFRQSLSASGKPLDVTGAQLRFPTATQPNKITFEYSFNSGNARGLLMPYDFVGSTWIGILPDMTLRGCAKCKLVLPKPLFDDHFAPFLAMEDCTAHNAEFREYHPNREVTDRVVVGWIRDPLQRLKKVQALLGAIVRGKNNVPSDEQNLLRGLRAFKPAELDAIPWLHGLVDAIEMLIQLRKHSLEAPLEMLVTASRQTEGYLPALQFILESIEGTVEPTQSNAGSIIGNMIVTA